MKTHTHLQYRAQFFLQWENFWKKVAENLKTHIWCSKMFSRKSCRLWDNVQKYGACTLRAGYL